MVIVEHAPKQEEIIQFVDHSIALLSESGHPAHAILLGPEAYRTFQEAMADMLHRDEGTFMTYNYLPLVVDPTRGSRICVLASPAECSGAVEFVHADG